MTMNYERSSVPTSNKVAQVVSLGHDCAGIDAVSVALDMLNIDVEYEFASEVNKSCVNWSIILDFPA